METFNDVTYVMYGTEAGELITGPALMIEGQLWLVPKWTTEQGGQFWRPAIAIRLPMELVQATPNALDYHYLLSGSVPKQALGGLTSQLLGARFVAVVEPEWRVLIPTAQ